MKGLALVSALALAAGVGLAHAGEVTGTIEEMDEVAGTFSLDDGTTYTLGEGVSLEGWEAGQEVTVSFEEGDDGLLIVTGIHAAEDIDGEMEEAAD